MATSKSEAERACHACDESTRCYWTDRRGRMVPLCQGCAEDLFVEEIDDPGEEFPEESHDDLLPDDYDDEGAPTRR